MFLQPRFYLSTTWRACIHPRWFAPRAKQVLFAAESPVDLDDGLKLNLGQEKEITNWDAISGDPLLICEVG